MSLRRQVRRQRLVCWRWLWAAIFVAVSTGTSAAEVELVLSEQGGAYAEVAAALRQDLGQAVSIREATAAAVEGDSDASGKSLVIALGSRAMRAVLPARNVAVIAALVPRDAFETVLQAARETRDPKTVTAIYLDQPYARQLDLVRAVLPGRARVGVLSSTATENELRLVQTAAKTRKLTVIDEPVTAVRDIYPALTKVLASTDVILAMPDPMIFNNGTIHNILLAAYREERPLIGFSPAYVRAGALAAVYSTPQQIAQQIAETVQRALDGKPLPPPEYLRSFTVGVNTTVARSLGLTVEGGAALEAKLRVMERER